MALFAVDVATGKSRMLVGEGTTLAPADRRAGPRALRQALAARARPSCTRVARDGRDDRARDATSTTSAWPRPASASPSSSASRAPAARRSTATWCAPWTSIRATKYPVAFLIHGGPQGSFGNDFHYRWNPQAYAGAGYAAVMVDFHGSTGYGQAFTDSIRGDWGGKPFEDLQKGLDHALATYPFLDGDRVGALGASYGGYMINWIAGN